MRYISYFILQFFSIIQPCLQLPPEEINRDTFIIITNKTNEIEHSNENLVSRTTPEPSRNSSTTSRKMITHYHCRDSGECPYQKSFSINVTDRLSDNAKQVAGITFALYLLIFNIV